MAMIASEGTKSPFSEDTKAPPSVATAPSKNYRQETVGRGARGMGPIEVGTEDVPTAGDAAGARSVCASNGVNGDKPSPQATATADADGSGSLRDRRRHHRASFDERQLRRRPRARSESGSVSDGDGDRSAAAQPTPRAQEGAAQTGQVAARVEAGVTAAKPGRSDSDTSERQQQRPPRRRSFGSISSRTRIDSDSSLKQMLRRSSSGSVGNGNVDGLNQPHRHNSDGTEGGGGIGGQPTAQPTPGARGKAARTEQVAARVEAGVTAAKPGRSDSDTSEEQRQRPPRRRSFGSISSRTRIGSDSSLKQMLRRSSSGSVGNGNVDGPNQTRGGIGQPAALSNKKIPFDFGLVATARLESLPPLSTRSKSRSGVARLPPPDSVTACDPDGGGSGSGSDTISKSISRSNSGRSRRGSNSKIIPSGDGDSSIDVRGVCTKCGKHVTTSQERDKDSAGNYFHVNCP
jgi:hypothetical protein